MAAVRSLRIVAPAKVNLALSVGSPVAGGMHPIATWMVAVHFADEVRIETLEGPGSELQRSAADDAPVAQAIDWPLEQDLAFRAHALLERHVGRPLPVRIAVTKRIPAGAGLGGGSSDAAAVLIGLNRLLSIGLDRDALMALGRQLGSDVPFMIAALSGQPSAIATGLGDELEAAPLGELIPLVLIFAPFGCPTGEVYQALDRLRAESSAPFHSPDLPAVRRLAAQRPVPQDGPFNDLAEAAFALRPELRSLRNAAQAALALPVHVTGSGSTIFVVAPSALTAKVLARKVTATTGVPAVATRSLAVTAAASASAAGGGAGGAGPGA